MDQPEQLEMVELDYRWPGRLEYAAARLLVAEFVAFKSENEVPYRDVVAALNNFDPDTQTHYALVRKKSGGYRQLIGTAEVVFGTVQEPETTFLELLAIRPKERKKHYGEQIVRFVARRSE